MEQRPLGRTGVSVSKLCLGAMMFGDDRARRGRAVLTGACRGLKVSLVRM
jgi:aryl-alcohol dehydrogenase-like predicted oxidoreductase